MLRGCASGKPRLAGVGGSRARLAQAGAARGDKRNRRSYLGSRQSVRASPLSPMCLPGPSSRGNQAFPPRRGSRAPPHHVHPLPGSPLLPLAVSESSGEEQTRLDGCWVPSPCPLPAPPSSAPPRGAAPHRSPRPPTRPRVGPGSPHGRALQGCDQLQQRARDSSSGEAKGSHE